jgi:tetratricopeptide (TPR) repeat protein
MIVLLCAALAISAADPARAAKDFAEANELALKGEAKSAIALYEAVLSSGVENADLYLNLGNVYAESGREVDAIIAYERGLRLAPGDGDLRANLTFLRARAEKKNTEANAEGTVVLADAIDPFVSLLPVNAFAFAAIGASFLLFGALLFKKRSFAIMGAVGLALSLTVVGGHLVLARDPRGVINQSAELKEGPHERFKASGRVPAGARVRVIEEEPGFVKILRQDGTSGWVSAKSVTRV